MADLKALRDHVEKFGISTAHMMKVLSDDAKIVAGGHFGMMRPGKGELIFRMRESRPTARMQAALDELVAAGAIERRDEPGGAVAYRNLANMQDFFRWAGRQTHREDLRFKVIEPIVAGQSSQVRE